VARPVPVRGVAIAVAAVAIGAAVVAAISWSLGGGVPGASDLRRELSDRGTVLVVGGDDLRGLAAGRTRARMVREVPAVEATLDGMDGAAVGQAMAANGIDGLLVDARGAGPIDSAVSVRQRLAAYGHEPSLVGVYLAPVAALYARSAVGAIGSPFDEALAHVARAVVGGERPPRIPSFPEPLRRMRNVEIMVMLKRHGQPRLWRSARGSSIASALLTAALKARERWQERESAMRGSIDDALSGLDVEVALLEEDGTLGVRTRAFVDRVFTPEHGVAYERRGSWRYLLPEATLDDGRGSPARAYEALFESHGLEADAFERTDLRLYRLVARTLARSPAPESESPDGESSGGDDGAGSDAPPAADDADGSAGSSD